MNIIKSLREHLKMNQEDFGKWVGVSRISVSQYETNKKQPRIKIAKKILLLAEINNYPVRMDDIFNR